jgi:hypothetical protein
VGIDVEVEFIFFAHRCWLLQKGVDELWVDADGLVYEVDVDVVNEEGRGEGRGAGESH